jgi:hypothetical protein
MKMKLLLNTATNCGQMTILIHHWIFFTFVKNFGEWTDSRVTTYIWSWTTQWILWTYNAKEFSMCENIEGVWTICWCKTIAYLKLLFQMDNYVSRTIKLVVVFFVVIIDSQGVVWRSVVGLPCCWSYTWRHWWKFWLFVKRIWKNKMNYYACWQTWWKFLWFHRNYSSPNSYKKLLISNPRSRLFEGWPWSIDWTYMYAFFSIFCGFFWVANDVVIN